jgi:hypothetical protein
MPPGQPAPQPGQGGPVNAVLQHIMSDPQRVMAFLAGMGLPEFAGSIAKLRGTTGHAGGHGGKQGGGANNQGTPNPAAIPGALQQLMAARAGM